MEWPNKAVWKLIWSIIVYIKFIELHIITLFLARCFEDEQLWLRPHDGARIDDGIEIEPVNCYMIATDDEEAPGKKYRTCVIAGGIHQSF